MVRNIAAAALSAALMGGCVNMDTANGITFVRSSSLFEPAATVVMQGDSVLSVLGGPSPASTLAGPGGQIGAAVLERPDQTAVSVSGVSSSRSSSASARPGRWWRPHR